MKLVTTTKYYYEADGSTVYYWVFSNQTVLTHTTYDDPDEVSFWDTRHINDFGDWEQQLLYSTIAGIPIK